MIHHGYMVHPEIYTLWLNQVLTVLNTVAIIVLGIHFYKRKP